ncbi:MAG TPA: hypothetical protein VF053_15710 [Streptosporangiales bacterium]
MSSHARPISRISRLFSVAVISVRATWRMWVVASVAAVIAAMVGPGLVANAATSLGIGVVHNKNIAYHAVTDSKINYKGVGFPKLSQYTQDKINGKLTVVAVTAQTQMTNREDGGHSGTWAHDNMLRVLAIQRHGQVDVSHCGGSEADQCWFYTATISDSGSFTTVDGAKSPRQGVAINGIVSGTVTGVGRYEFYSTDDTPNAGLVPATEDGNVHGSATWPKLAFTDGSVYNVTEHKYAYAYTAPKTCETWTETSANSDGQAGDAGDITGVSACK